MLGYREFKDSLKVKGNKLQADDLVLWVNDYGVAWVSEVIGFNEDDKGLCVYFSDENDAYWFPHREENLKRIDNINNWQTKDLIVLAYALDLYDIVKTAKSVMRKGNNKSDMQAKGRVILKRAIRKKMQQRDLMPALIA